MADTRFRLDTQNEDTRDLGGLTFATRAQDEHDRRVAHALKQLRDRRIDVVSRAGLPDGHVIALADLLHVLDVNLDPERRQAHD